MSDISKLPKWAQEHIKTLERERDIATRELNEHLDGLTASAFYYEDYVSTGEEGSGPSLKRTYVQTRKITVCYAGVELDILVRNEQIELQWSDTERHLREVAFVPSSFQSARLLSRSNIRE